MGKEYSKKFGISHIVNPKPTGTPNLVWEGSARNVESFSILTVERGFGCMEFINGGMNTYTEPGRYYVRTGQWPVFKSVQNFWSKGETTFTSSYYFFNTETYVYKDIKARIQDVCVVDPLTKLQINCSPELVFSIRIVNPYTFFQQYASVDFENDAVGEFVIRQVGPIIRNYIVNQAREKGSILDLNADTSPLSPFCISQSQGYLSQYGLGIKNIIVTNLNIHADDMNNLRGYHEQVQNSTILAKKTKIIADQLFGGDMQKASKYLIMNEMATNEGGGNSPMAFAMAIKMLNDQF